MLRVKKNKLFFLALFFLFLFLGAFVFAQELEIKYPGIPGAPLPAEPTLPEFIRYIYVFSIIIAGLVAFASLVYGGFRYLTSIGSPVAMADARDQITAGIIGLIILLASYLILTILNPQLVIFKLDKGLTELIECDCSLPLGDQPFYCERICEPIPSRPPEVSTALEVPIGTLIELALEKEEEGLPKIKALIDEGAAYSKEVNDKAIALAAELENCNCSRATPDPPDCEAGLPCDNVCIGEPCDRDKLAQLRKELRDAYSEFEGWMIESGLFEQMAKLRKEALALYVAKLLLEESVAPLSFFNFLEVKQTIMDAGGEVEVKPFVFLGEAIGGEQDPANFYFDTEMNKGLIEELLFNLETNIRMWDIIGEGGWTPLPFPPGQEVFVWPTSGCISQYYDTSHPRYSTGCHRAVDIAANRGEPVSAALGGKVYKVVNDCVEGDTSCGGGLGNYVALEHEFGGVTFYTVYGHLDKAKGVPVSVGDNVNQGDVIGYIDNTGLSLGDHLDFRLMTVDAPWGITFNPMDFLPPPDDAGIGICEACGSTCHDPSCAPPAPPFACDFGTGPCSVENLKPIFGEQAWEASIVCQRESGSNPGVLNDNCLWGISADYSVGLFQMNLLDRCPLGIQWTGDFGNPLCWITNQDELDRCEADYGLGNPAANIQKAKQLYDAVGWCPPGGWAAAGVCGLCP